MLAVMEQPKTKTVDDIEDGELLPPSSQQQPDVEDEVVVDASNASALAEKIAEMGGPSEVSVEKETVLPGLNKEECEWWTSQCFLKTFTYFPI